MAYSSYYGRKRAVNSGKTVIKYLGGGLNEKMSPLNIPNNVLSNTLNTYSPDGLALRTYPNKYFHAYFPMTTTNDNYAFCSWNGSTSNLLPMQMTYSGTPAKWTAIQLLNAAGTAYSVASYAMEIDRENMTCGALEYITQAATYSIYWSALANFFIVQQQTTKALSSVTLPSGVYPKMMVSHMSRLFVLDHKNTLWWSKGGDYTEWYGETPTETYEALDDGYWFIGSDDTMNQMVVLAESIFIFGNNTIYRFDGWGNENFSLSRMFTGYGTYPYSHRSLATNNQLVFFVFNDKVYQFNGSSEPVLISEPIVRNGEYANGITNAIDTTQWKLSQTWKMRSVFCDNDNVYIYCRRSSGVSVLRYPALSVYAWAYVFDIRRKQWTVKDLCAWTNAAVTNKVYPVTMDVFPAKEATELSFACSFEGDNVNYDENFSFVTNTCYRQYTIGGVNIAAKNTDFDIPYVSFFNTGSVATSLDDKTYLHEIDVVWRYADTHEVYLEGSTPPFIQKLSFGINVSKYAQGSDTDKDQGGSYTNSSEDSYHFYADENSFSEYMYTLIGGVPYGNYDSYYLGLVLESDNTWNYPQVTKFMLKDEDKTSFGTPFVRLNIWNNFPSIEILRMELKYRTIGAGR